MRCAKCEKELHDCKCIWAIPIVCQRCGEVNPAEIHTCTPIENSTTEKNIQTSDKND